jgi:prepilin-type processing-associated H-X9-DG protein
LTSAAAGGTKVRTAHLEQQARPAGGNLLFLDNHVEWRRYGSMTNRVQVPGRPMFEF